MFRDLFCKCLENHHWNSSLDLFTSIPTQSLNPVKTAATEQDMTMNGAVGLVFLRRRSLNHVMAEDLKEHDEEDKDDVQECGSGSVVAENPAQS
ncbi:hypothetical protein HA466_0271500 [Hirschfeldia incana]|nr:hypothetical protein HA466_0271500 [Hirschfeldia incana]